MDTEKENRLKAYFASKNVRQVILFGSHARGTATNKSDYDIIIIEDSLERFFDRYDRFNDLYPILDNNADILIYTADEWESMKNRLFFRNILKEAHTLYVSGT